MYWSRCGLYSWVEIILNLKEFVAGRIRRIRSSILTFSRELLLWWMESQSRQSAKLFFQSLELGLPPTPHPQASVPPPPCFWGEGNTRWWERGWESPNSDEGHTLWYSLYVRTLWMELSMEEVFNGIKGREWVLPQRELERSGPDRHLKLRRTGAYIVHCE